MAASKTFNVAGLGCSFAIVPSAELRARFQRAGRDLVPHPSYPGYFAAEAAFTRGKPWLEALREHLRDNRDRLAEVINTLPGLRYRPQPATFLAWIETDLAPGRSVASLRRRRCHAQRRRRLRRPQSGTAEFRHG